MSRISSSLHAMTAFIPPVAPTSVPGGPRFGVVASAAAVALGLTVADPLIGLAITALILRITWHAWRTVSADTDLDHSN